MPRRTALTIALLLALLVLAGLLPGHPIVREPVLARLVEAAHAAGVTVRFDRSGGNLWRGLTLQGVEVRSEGIELRAAEARLGWFLPPLVTGELPLRVHLTDLTGDVDVARALTAWTPSEPADGGLPLPRLLWREVEFSGADVTIADVPFTLPDVQVVDIGVSGDGDDLALDLTLRTADGSAELVGRADARTGQVVLQVVAADATLARAWWDGVTAGTVRGEVRIGDGLVTAEGHVEDGVVEAYGARVDGISGPVRWDGARVHTELGGNAAGGSVVAQGIVDVPAARWSATGRADVALESLTPILWGLGVAGPPPPSEGRVTAAVRVEGWTSARVEVDAVVDGSVYGLRAEALDADVRFADGRLSVVGGGAFAGGRLDLRVDVADAVTDVAASLVGGAWGPLEVDTLAGALRFGAEPTGSAEFSGSLALGDGVPISADMALDADGASLFVESAEVAGARLRGALVAPRLAGDAPLDGGLQLLLPDAVWSGAAPAVSLQVDGTIGAPGFALTVAGDAPARPRLGPWVGALDLRGAVRLAIADGGATLDGALGEVTVDGGIGGERTLALRLPELAWTGPVALATPALDVRLAQAAGGWSLDDDAGRASLALDADGWRARLTTLAFDVAGVELTLDGTAGAAPDGGWNADVVVTTPTVPARLTAAGDAFGGVDATLTAADVTVEARGAPDGLTARLGVAGDELRFAAADGAWRLAGDVPVAPFLALAGVEGAWAGRLTSALGADADGVRGEATLALDAPLPALVVVTADDLGLAVSLRADAAGEAWTLDGRLTPDLALTAGLGPLGPVRLDAAGGAGAGALPDLAAGPVTLPLGAWRADVDLAEAAATLVLGGSTLTVSWRDGIDAALALDQRVDAGPAPWARLRGALAWSPDRPDGPLALVLERVDGPALLRLDGTLAEASLTGSAAASQWSAPFGDGVRANGDLTWQGSVSATAGTADVTALWTPTPDGDALRVDAALGNGAASWRAQAPGLEAAGVGADWSASLASFSPTAWLALPALATDADLRLDGSIGRGAGGWTGALAIDLALGVDVDVAAELGGAGDALLLAGTARAFGDAIGDALVLSFDGRWDGAVASADLTLAPGTIEPLDWPEVRAEVRSDDGWHVRGDGGAWSLGAGGASGRWEQPLWLAGEPHLLVLDAADPALVRFAGALLEGDARAAHDGWHVSLASDAPARLARPFGAELAAALEPLAALRADVVLDPSRPGVYTLAAAGVWRLADGTGLDLEARLGGDAGSGAGRVRVGPDDPGWATVDVTYDAVGLRAFADLADLDVGALATAFDLPLDGALSGGARVALEDGTVDVSLDAGGTVRVGAFEATIAAGAADGAWNLVLAEAAGPWRLALAGDTATSAATLALTGPDSDLAGAVERSPDGPDGVWRLTAAGSLFARPTDLELTGDLGAAVADADWDGVALTATWRDERLSLTVDAPDDRIAAGPWHVSAELDAAADLPLRVAASGAGFALDVTGGAAPFHLRGPLRWDDDEAAVEIAGPDGGDGAWRVRLDDTLDLLWHDGALRLAGTLHRTLADVDVDLTSDLTWRDGDGFGGGAAALVSGLPADARLAADLVGAGDLEVAVGAWLGDAPAGAAGGRLAADPRDGWALDLDLDVPLAGTGIDAWRLSVAGRATGGAEGATLDTALALVGPVAAHGRAWLDGGALRADLVGEGLSASARWDDAGGRAQLRFADVDVRAWVPWLDAPRASLTLDATLGGEGPVVVADDLRLRTPGGSIGGQGRLGADGRLDVTARSDLDLADLDLGTALSGRLTGPFTLTTRLDRPLAEAELAGVLVLTAGRVEGVPGRYAGDLQVTGPAADPLVSLVLRADDGVEGSLRAQVRPRAERASVDADLRSGDASAVLQARYGPDDLRADGRVELAPGVALRVRTLEDGVSVVWDADPAALTVRVSSAPWRVAVRGDLALLTPALAGLVDAELGWVDGPWPVPSGTVRGLAVADVALGDARLDGTGGARAAWALTGDWGRLDVALPEGRLAASLTDVALPPLGADARLGLELGGTIAGLDGRATVDGSLGGAPVAVVLGFELDPGAGSGVLNVAGEALSGRLEGVVARSALGVWSGDVGLEGATLAGRDLRAEVALAGARALPGLDGSVALDELVTLSMSFDGDALEIDATAALDDVAAVRLAGRAWPELDLELTDPGTEGSGLLRLRGSWDDAMRPLRATGDVRVALGPVVVGLQGTEAGTLRLRATSDLVADGWLEQTLPDGPVASSATALGADGLLLVGRGSVQGAIALGADGALRIDALTLPIAGVGVRIDGAADGLDRIEASVRADLAAFAGAPWLPVGFDPSAPLEAQVTLAEGRLVVASAAPWSLRLDADLATRAVVLQGDVTWATPDGEAGLRGELRAAPGVGVSGTVSLANVVVDAAEGAPVRVDGSVRGIGGGVDLDLTLRSRRSAVSARGRAPLPATVLAGWYPDAPSVVRSIDLRVAALDLRDVPGVATAVPFVTGVVTGSLVVRGDRAIGQLVAGDLRIAERDIPLVATVSADLALPSAEVRIEGTGGPSGGVGSNVAVSWQGGRFEALARLERFPLHTLAEGLVGPSDVSAEVTGVVRAGWDPSDATPIDLRVATEHVRLERDGVVTTGRIAFDLADGALRIQEASFEGRGAWQARGEVRPDRIDLELSADGADFGPLLGLVPALARFGVSAEGDLRIVGSGSVAQPVVTVASQRLQVDVAGTSYEVRDGDVRLEGDRLAVALELAAVAPLEGTLRVSGGGRLQLSPFDLDDVRLEAVGDLDIPLLGRVEGIEAALTQRSGGSPSLLVDGVLGAPFRIDGTLAPFDLRAVGRGLQLAVPFLFVGNAVLDADLRARIDDGLVLSGVVDASSVRIDLGARAAAIAPADGAAATLSASERAARRAAQSLVVFDRIRIVAPQRVTLAETLGTAEAAFDLTLTGSVAEPQLQGTANALRGTFRFSGRDFELVRADARFDPAQGVLPRISVVARSVFEKARVVAPGSAITFATPPGPRFEVVLAFDADVTADAAGEVNLDLVPSLTSDATIEVPAAQNGLSAGARPLTDLELLGLIALGRLEPGGGGAFAGAVAQTALDTALDLLVVSELQAALSDALGIDLVEIRTSALTDLFDGSGDPFGVSLRFGGYLSDELFASYRVGTFDDAERAFAFTNEVLLTYDLGPVAFDLSGRLDFPTAGAGQPVPGVSAAVRYDISRSFALEAGVDLRTERQTARLGVTLRW